MAGVLPAVFGFSRRPKGHGYTIVRVDKPNPFYAPGSTLLGHEFHYSSVKAWKGREENLAFSMQRGTGFWMARTGSASTTSWPPIPISMPWERRVGRLRW